MQNTNSLKGMCYCIKIAIFGKNTNKYQILMKKILLTLLPLLALSLAS